MKDQVAAQNLLEEIEIAKLQHPTARQSTTFISHADALLKRLYLRGNPASSSSTFPCPVHPLFPDQPSSNEALAQSLSSEIGTAMDLVKKVDSVAKEYRATFEAVRDVEALSQTAQTLATTFTSVHERFTNGVPASDSDGSPPDLTSKACLDPTRHSAFLTLLPDILKESNAADEKTTPLLRAYRAAVLNLDRPGIDASFKSNAISEINRLGQQRDVTQKLKNDVVARVGRLRDARKLWDIMEDALEALEETKREVGDAMERKRWRQQAAPSGTPLTPESPVSPLPSPTVSSTDVLNRLDNMHIQLSREVATPLYSLSVSLEAPLNDWLSQSFTGLTTFLDSLKQMSRLLEAIQRQASVMGAVRQDVEDFQIHIEELKIRFDSAFRNALGDGPTSAESDETAAVSITDAKELRDAIQTFMDGLSQRVPFVVQRDLPSQARPNFVRKRFASVDVKLGASPQSAAIELPFDLTSLDDAVRTDSNAYVMRLAGELQSLDTKKDYFQLAQLAKEVDLAVGVTVDDIHCVTRRVASLKTSLSQIGEGSGEAGSITESLRVLLREVDDFSHAYRSRISRSFSPIRDLLRRMDGAPGCHDFAVHELLYVARTRTVDDAELKFSACNEEVASLKTQISDVQRAEAQRLEREMLERERLQEEREGLENQKREQERLRQEKLEQERLECERLEHERREQERLEQERIERERLEHGRLEQERIVKEQFERERLERERLEQERIEKERVEKERLEHERLEQDRIEMELLEHERLERERLEKEWMERERLAEEARLLMERELFEAAQEQERLEIEGKCRAKAEEHARLLRLEEELAQAERDKREAAARRATAVINEENEEISQSKGSDTG